MASNLISHTTFAFLILLPFFATQSFSFGFLPTTPFSPETICNFTQDPSYCQNVLLPNKITNFFNNGRFVILKSLLKSYTFSKLIDGFLKLQSSFSHTTIRALLDCQQLARLNVDYLQTSYGTVNKTGVNLSGLEQDDVQTLLSAILTNMQTCLEGIQITASDWSEKSGLSVSLFNDTKLYSLSLALFTKGWVSLKENWTTLHPIVKHPSFRNGRLPLNMSSRTRAIYERVSGRSSLVQEEDEGVVTVNDIVIVSRDGSGNFTTINDAVSAAPNNTDFWDGYFMIYVTAGVYEEYVSIEKSKKNLLMIGDGINRTIITGNRSVVDGWTTFNSATFVVVAEGFIAVNITFRNTAGAIKHQAVALRSGADMSTFYRCSFEGYQDTLYTHSMRQFYRECDIYGTVDFIFGNAAAVLQNCNIYPRLPLNGQFNCFTAQGRTNLFQNTGIAIHNSKIRAADDLAASNGSTQTYLGRPWKEYSRTVYMKCFMDSLINPAGWREWAGDFALRTLFYVEYDNNGPGSNTTNRVTWPGYHAIDVGTLQKTSSFVTKFCEGIFFALANTCFCEGIFSALANITYFVKFFCEEL